LSAHRIAVTCVAIGASHGGVELVQLRAGVVECRRERLVRLLLFVFLWCGVGVWIEVRVVCRDIVLRDLDYCFDSGRLSFELREFVGQRRTSLLCFTRSRLCSKKNNTRLIKLWQKPKQRESYLGGSQCQLGGV
jgi:hypothetical protein